MTDEMKRKVLSTETLVPVGVLVALLIPLILTTWRAGAEFTRFTSRLDSLEMSVSRQSWGYNMERQAWVEFSLKNPGMKIPDTERIRREWRGE